VQCGDRGREHDGGYPHEVKWVGTWKLPLPSDLIKVKGKTWLYKRSPLTAKDHSEVQNVLKKGLTLNL
jgi:hypothetical protein